jgi:uncharacterized membrane protein
MIGGEEGAIAILTAVVFSILMGFAALAVDVGYLFFQRRHLQGAVDAAALAGAWQVAADPSRVQAVVQASLAGNGYPDVSAGGGNLVISTGTYRADASLAPGQRFQVGATPLNAVNVRATVQAPIFLARLFMDEDEVGLAVSATATQIDMAAFNAGTGVASVGSGMINNVLGGLLGTNLSLSAIAYDGLINGRVDALTFLDALATRIGLQAGTYDDLLTSTVSVGNVVDAAIDALAGSDLVGAAAAVAGLQALRAQISGLQTLTVGHLIDVAAFRDRTVGPPGRNALNAAINVFDLVSTTAQIANGTDVVDLGAAIAVPIVGTSIATQMTMIEPAQSAPRIGLGPEGIQVHTAQTRLLLDITLANVNLIVAGVTVRVPLYIEIGGGDAVLSDITCAPDPANTTVMISATSGAANVLIGDMGSSWLTNYTQPVPDVPPYARIAQINVLLLGLVDVLARGRVSVGAGSATPLTYTVAEIEAGTVKTAVSQGMTGNLIGSLASSLSVEARLLGIPINLGGLVGGVLGLLTPVLAALDPVVDGLLRVLGIRLGYIDVKALGVRCGVPVLVG